MLRLAAGLAALAMLLPGAMPAQAQTTGGTFSLPINDDPQIWPVAGGLYNILVNKVVYSGLVRYDLETLEPVGDLAESWEVSEDGLTYTFTLRDNVLWHDGEPFNADDVVFTINEIWTNEEVPYYLANNFRLIEEATRVNDFTVEVSLSQPQPSLPVLMGYNAAVLPEHLLSELTPEQLVNPTEFLQNPVGTGPFKFVEYSPGAYVQLARNEDYFDGVPHLDAMTFRIVPDANAQLALLQSGEVDLVVIEPFQLEAIENNPNVQIQSVPVNRHEFVAINNGVEALSDVNVRKALTMGLDRETLLQAVFAGRGTVATGPFTPAVGWAYDTSIEPLPYDPEAAAALLDEAGWVLGGDGIRAKDGVPLSFTLLYDPSNPTRARTALVAQQQWGALGIQIGFETSEYRAIVERIRQSPPDYELNPNYLIAPPDPDGIANYYLSDSLANSWAYNNPEVDALLNEGATTGDQAARAEIYKQVQAIMHEDQPNVFTVYPDEIQALSAAVERFPEAGYRDALGWAHLISKSQ
ncbi:ABC transporter substrate-binding protein [Pelagibacterium sp. 26DY04]|uniref:ABC transporter substrate-binding protein n=1 Tax=Pelagibacterium sp. 26DY04 TaxID=2967130 RepID=UPI00281573D1|nr:ABC transporter substrate-binding protein [Pelagibacterium sp. 26DY04]WMT88472.1 ABC transporter substrate-binding protein [Pelagibacterium sp. 26DY04]